MDTPPTSDRPRRRDAAKHILHPHTLRDGMRIAPQPHVRASAMAGVQAAMTGAIAMPLIYISPFAHLLSFAALGSIVALYGRFAPAQRRNWLLLYCMLSQTAVVLVTSTAAWLGAPNLAMLIVLALCCGGLMFVQQTVKMGAPGALLMVFAAGASFDTPVRFVEIIERGLTVMLVGLLAWAICFLTEKFRNDPSAFVPGEPALPRKRRIEVALSITLATFLAAAASQLIGASHPSWAAMGAMAAMTGPHLYHALHRGVQRLLGVVIGAAIAGVILIFEPNVWQMMALIVGLQIITEIIIGSNYALGQMLVTPMALLMTVIGMPGVSGFHMASERIWDTLIGAAIGLVLAILLSSQPDRLELAAYKAAKGNKS